MTSSNSTGVKRSFHRFDITGTVIPLYLALKHSASSLAFVVSHKLGYLKHAQEEQRTYA
jgi:hypothetical protein